MSDELYLGFNLFGNFRENKKLGRHESWGHLKSLIKGGLIDSSLKQTQQSAHDPYEWPVEIAKIQPLKDETLLKLFTDCASKQFESINSIEIEFDNVDFHLIIEEDGNSWLLYNLPILISNSALFEYNEKNKGRSLGDILFESASKASNRIDSGLLNIIHHSSFANTLLVKVENTVKSLFLNSGVHSKFAAQGKVTYGNKIVHSVCCVASELDRSVAESILTSDGSDKIALASEKDNCHKGFYLGWSFSIIVADENCPGLVKDGIISIASCQATWHFSKLANRRLSLRADKYFQTKDNDKSLKKYLIECDAASLRLNKRINGHKAFVASLPPFMHKNLDKLLSHWELEKNLENLVSSNREIIDVYSRKLSLMNYENQKRQEVALIILAILQSITLLEIFKTYENINNFAINTSGGKIGAYQLFSDLKIDLQFIAYMAEYSLILILIPILLILSYLLGPRLVNRFRKSKD